MTFDREIVSDGESSVVWKEPGTGALSNFEYDSLTSGVTYTEDGEMSLQMRLSGLNPEIDPTQPYVLNLNLEQNLLQMLKSLRAIRSIEDILSRRATKQTN